ncbi:hypothetical protein ND486_00500 [Pseudonocardia sp. DR1-2]|uniref:hypothetical protein n=1 Tax=Pseudonocardia sp. DR1-2 TaxID=2951168 RepID=UPI002044516B|nr:hypothetical protein [Pseudonocardia sp. DR1-2]MCM3844672.1 hypothetical protein [Pseudonocardia sp. DR1-2]
MADVVRLRDHILRIATSEGHPLADRFSVNDLYRRVAACAMGIDPVVGRATFYTWFNHQEMPKQSMLEYIPAFAKVLAVEERTLWAAAGVLAADDQLAPTLGAVARDIRLAYRRMRKVLSENGLSTAGEALVVDRILHRQLDYRMTVWPVVRGTTVPIHLHSWIVLEPIERIDSTRRLTTSVLERADPGDRRRYLREEVVTEGLWRRLGLKWRNRLPAEFSHLGDRPLFIEVPVEERGRTIDDDREAGSSGAGSVDGVRTPAPSPGTRVPRLLVLGAPWSHAELMAALLADALRFASWDLRYIGLPEAGATEAKEAFARQRLRERSDRVVWAVAQRYDVMERLRADVLDSVADGAAPVVVVTYGPRMTTFAATALAAPWDSDIGKAVTVLESLARRLREHTDVVEVTIHDDDLLGPAGAHHEEPLVRDLAVDHIRYLTARVLDELRRRNLGPEPRHWGTRFDDLVRGSHLDLPETGSTVRWLPRHGL